MSTKVFESLKELRAAEKLSQAAFGKALGVSATTVAAYESGKSHPNGKVLEKIVEVFGATLKTADRDEEKTGEKKSVKKALKAKVIIQSPMGGEITPEEILARIGEAETVYVRVDQNKAYWVNGEDGGEVDLW